MASMGPTRALLASNEPRLNDNASRLHTSLLRFVKSWAMVGRCDLGL
jgi:hypothetical protein